MKIRKNFLPRTIPDLLASAFLLTCIPLVLWFELYIVVPDFHDVGSPLYYFTIIAGVFIAFNISSNLIAVMLVDTSIKGEILTPPEDPHLKEMWRLCTVCEILAPPRSWHCSTCDNCILKRDHHCTFAGCCVGHRNHRYFLMLVTYLFVGTVYASIYNTIFFFWIHGEEFNHPTTFMKMIFPCLILLLNSSFLNYYLTLYVLNIIGFAFGLVLLVYHGKIILNGSVVHERRTAPKYNLGWRKNIEMVLGKRWYLVWLSPFIRSELPHDGIHWENICIDSVKNR